MTENQDWDVEVIVVEDSDGTVLGHSQSTDAYRIYGQDEDLAMKIGQAQDIAYDRNATSLAEHFRNTADARDRLDQQLAERQGRNR